MLAKQFMPTLKNFKLATLCEHFSIVNEDAHNAMGDIVATGKVLVRLIHDFVLHTQSVRLEIFNKYKSKFEGLFLFFSEANIYLEKGDFCSLCDFIQNSFNFDNSFVSAEALYDIRQILCSDEVVSPKVFLQEFLNNSSLSVSQMDILIKKLNRVPIITVHQSKGCEFDIVIIAGCNSQNFPSYLSVVNGNEREERSVFYVAISRAKKTLVLTSPSHHENDYGDVFYAKPSKYVDNIPRDLIDFC